MNKLVAARWFLKELEPMLLAYLYRCLRDMLLAYLGFRYLVTSHLGSLSQVYRIYIRSRVYGCLFILFLRVGTWCLRQCDVTS